MRNLSLLQQTLHVFATLLTYLSKLLSYTFNLFGILDTKGLNSKFMHSFISSYQRGLKKTQAHAVLYERLPWNVILCIAIYEDIHN